MDWWQACQGGIAGGIIGRIRIPALGVVSNLRPYDSAIRGSSRVMDAVEGTLLLWRTVGFRMVSAAAPFLLCPKAPAGLHFGFHDPGATLHRAGTAAQRWGRLKDVPVGRPRPKAGVRWSAPGIRRPRECPCQSQNPRQRDSRGRRRRPPTLAAHRIETWECGPRSHACARLVCHRR